MDPGAPGLAASTRSGCRAGRFCRAVARTRPPSARRSATSPTPAIFRLTIKGPQLRHPRAAAVSDLDPDHAACRPDRDRLARSA
jgi:hypothetical protein